MVGTCLSCLKKEQWISAQTRLCDNCREFNLTVFMDLLIKHEIINALAIVDSDNYDACKTRNNIIAMFNEIERKLK